MTSPSPWPNFSWAELRCKCGRCDSDGREIDPRLMDAVQRLRERYGQPLIVSSAYRCPNHPAERGKARPGAHAMGTAIDLEVFGGAALAVLRLALENPLFTGIGVQQKGACRFIHLDIGGGDLPRPMLWSY